MRSDEHLRVDGQHLMAWLSETLQGAGVDEEDPIAGLLVELVVEIRPNNRPNRDYVASLIRGAAEHYAAVRTRADRLERTEGLLREACRILDEVGAGGVEGDARAFLAKNEITELLEDDPNE